MKTESPRNSKIDIEICKTLTTSRKVDDDLYNLRGTW